MKRQETPKLLRVRVNDHQKCADDVAALPVHWQSAFIFHLHPDYREKLQEHVKSGALEIEE